MDEVDVFSAIANPVRRQLLGRLRHGPRTAGDLARGFEIGRPAVSEHLQVLRRAHLVRDEPRGRERYYHLDPRPLSDVEAWVGELSRYWKQQLEALEAVLEDETRSETLPQVEAPLMETATAVATHRFAHPCERVFDAWIDPVIVRKWASLPHPVMGALDIRRIEIDARVAGRFLFSDMREEGEAVHWGEYRVIDRPRLLVFTWWTSPEEEQADNSVVTIRFEPHGDGCLVTLEHEMSAEWREYVERTATAWGGMLEQVDALLSAG